jgi:hypothetical protein
MKARMPSIMSMILLGGLVACNAHSPGDDILLIEKEIREVVGLMLSFREKLGGAEGQDTHEISSIRKRILGESIIWVIVLTPRASTWMWATGGGKIFYEIAYVDNSVVISASMLFSPWQPTETILKRDLSSYLTVSNGALNRYVSEPLDVLRAAVAYCSEDSLKCSAKLSFMKMFKDVEGCWSIILSTGGLDKKTELKLILKPGGEIECPDDGDNE